MRDKHLILPVFYVLVLVWIALGMGGVILEYINS
jgi:hypothetical protein